MMSKDSAIQLQHFIDAQESIYVNVLRELKQGEKVSHWMWFIFPQIAGLGYSPSAIKFAIESEEEAKAYLAHPILGERLKICTQLVNEIVGRSAYQIFGHIDALKFRSSMTLFNYIDKHNPIFEQALIKYYDSKPDQLTLKILKEIRTTD